MWLYQTLNELYFLRVSPIFKTSLNNRTMDTYYSRVRINFSYVSINKGTFVKLFRMKVLMLTGSLHYLCKLYGNV